MFDALTSARRYKAGWSLEDSVAEIRAQSGRQFDPMVVEAFLSVLPMIEAIRGELHDADDAFKGRYAA